MAISAPQKKASDGEIAGSARERVRELLSYADIELDGTRPWDIRANDPDSFRSHLTGPLLSVKLTWTACGTVINWTS